MDIFSNQEYVERALDASDLRQQAISNNLAHANDPTWRGQTVCFEDSMAVAIDKWNGVDGESDAERQAGKEESGQVEASVESAPNTGVDMNQEMVNLAKNQILYTALTSQMSGYFKSLKYVIDNAGH